MFSCVRPTSKVLLSMKVCISNCFVIQTPNKIFIKYTLRYLRILLAFVSIMVDDALERLNYGFKKTHGCIRQCSVITKIAVYRVNALPQTFLYLKLFTVDC